MLRIVIRVSEKGFNQGADIGVLRRLIGKRLVDNLSASYLNSCPTQPVADIIRLK